MALLSQSSKPAAAPRAGMRFCPTCKAEIANGARTCPHCGKTFTTSGGIFFAILLGLLLGGFFLLRR
jgi:predicted amidophosphoribosyltransferase